MAEIFSITHEVGDLSEYDSTETNGGDLSVTMAAALVGSYGLNCLVDVSDIGDFWGQVDFTQLTSTEYWFRFYLDPNGLTMASGNAFDLVRVSDTANIRTLVRLRDSSGNYQVMLRTFNDALAAQSTSFYTITDDVHYVDCLIEYASSAVASDATATLWIGGSLQEQLTGLDIYDISKPDNARIGAPTGLDAGMSGTFFIDDFVFRNDDAEVVVTGNPWNYYAQM